jgi:hypothetical protein
VCLLLDIVPHLPEYENRTRFCAENWDQATLAGFYFSVSIENRVTVVCDSESAFRRDDMLKEGHVLQLMIDLLERQEKEERGFAESLIPKA